MVVGLPGNESPDGERFTLVYPKSENDVRLQGALGSQNPTGLPVGVVSSGTGMTLRANAYHSKFEKVRSVKGKRADNLIWVNTFLQYQQVYVPKSAYNFVWNYITERCVNAKIIYD